MKAVCCRGLDAVLGFSAGYGGGDSEYELLGAAAPEAKTYLVMHVENPAGLVEKEKGKGLAWATSFVPQYIESKIYNTTAEQMKKQFKEKGSDVSIDIVSSPPNGVPLKSDLLGGVVLGIIVSALGYGAYKLAVR